MTPPERPILISNGLPKSSLLLYTFRDSILCVDTFMTPCVLDWLTAAFGDPARTALWEQCIHRVTSQGSVAIGARLNSFGVLQVCLMATAPFQDCADNHVWDLRYDPPQTVCCRNWEQLVEALANALFYYLAYPYARDQTGEELIEEAQAALRVLQRVTTTYETLRTRRALKTQPTQLPPARKRIAEAHQTFRQAVEALTAEDYLRVGNVEQHNRRQLISGMHSAFMQYGPQYHRYKYPKRANLHAIAEILAQFGIEQDRPATIADRIHKRLTRL